MSEKTKEALEMFQKGFNCAQSVFGTFCDQYGLDKQLALKTACGFGGGMRCGEVCGAVTGAVMVIGLHYGQYDSEDMAAKKACYETTTDFMKRYSEKKGTVLCREILGYDIRDNAARDKNPGRVKEICPCAIEAAVELLEEMGF